jgi:rhodanese-related sulfurtransferase
MKNITKEDWKKLVKETDNAVVIDVRTPEEWAKKLELKHLTILFFHQ